MHLRDALPNASFIGLTGTPIETDEVNTPALFGDYIDIYDISRAVEDGAMVPIDYESRLARMDLPDAEILARQEEAAQPETDPEAKKAACGQTSPSSGRTGKARAHGCGFS